MPKSKNSKPRRPPAQAGPLVFGVTHPPGTNLGGSAEENKRARAALLASPEALLAAQNLSPRPSDPPKCQERTP